MTDSHAQDGGSVQPTDSIAPITEKQLARLWQRRAARSRALRTQSGRRVRVLYPGRSGVTAGPDFRNALLLVEGDGLVQGDVEVHLRQRDWRAHGHHRDPNYNGVALHVTLNPQGAPSTTVGGASPPVVALDPLTQEGGDENGSQDETTQALWAILAQHGFRQPESPEQMASVLNRAGDQRFLSRSRELQMLASRQSPEQTLWEAICEALGYRNNRHPFLMLANAAPIATLTQEAKRLPETERASLLTGWLMRLAGLNDKDRDTPTPGLPSGIGPELGASQWRLYRVRPSNHPRRRIRGAGAILARYAESGLIAGLAQRAAIGRIAELTKALTVSDSLTGKPALIGADRAKDTLVNAALPFLHGWYFSAGDTTGASAILELYRSCGALTENEITRSLAISLQDHRWPKVANNARRQQGLIHLQTILAGATMA